MKTDPVQEKQGRSGDRISRMLRCVTTSAAGRSKMGTAEEDGLTQQGSEKERPEQCRNIKEGDRSGRRVGLRAEHSCRELACRRRGHRWGPWAAGNMLRGLVRDPGSNRRHRKRK